MDQVILILIQLLNLFKVLLFIRIILSWVMPYADRYAQPYKLLYGITDPVMEPFRRLIPPLGGLDLSPMVVFLIISVLQSVLGSMLHRF